MTVQEYKVVREETGVEVFFVSRAFSSATKQCRAYLDRIKGPVKVYRRNFSSFGETWIEVGGSYV